MKRIFACILAVAFMIPCLASCRKEYEGPEIATLEYISVDYNGGTTDYTILDLTSGVVSTKTTIPGVREDAEYEPLYTIDTSKNKELLDQLYAAGLFSLEDNYTTDHIVDDGGGWSLIIKYADGTEKISKGSNAGPWEIFEKADQSFYDVTGGEFFGYISDSYKKPPDLYFSIEYRDGNNYYGRDIGTLTPYKYTWRNKTYETPAPYPSTALPISLDFDYELNLSMQLSEEKIKSVTLYIYEDNASEKHTVACDHDQKHIQFELSPNKNYILIVEYNKGSAEYLFNTMIASD